MNNTKSYYSNNKFFNNIIDEYYKNDPDCRWIKHGDSRDYTYICDIDFHKTHLINNCSIISQIDGIELLGNKKHQYRLMELNKPESIGDFIPKTYIFNTQTIRKLIPVFEKSKIKYIVKPDNSLCRKGVSIIINYNQLYNYINKSPYKCNWILQEYIEHPLLYNEKKFHFRVFVLLIKNAQNLKVYIYNKHFMYFADNKYRINKLDNESHLSGETRPENVKIYPEDFTGYFGDQYLMKINEQIRNIVQQTIEPCDIYLKCSNDNISGYKAFKLLGYDILIDKYNKCYLAEINVRQISVKYPPQDFKKTFYTNLLNTIHYPEKPTEFVLVTTIPNRNIIYKTMNNNNNNNHNDNNHNDNNNNNDPAADERSNRINKFINDSDKQNIEKTLSNKSNNEINNNINNLSYLEMDSDDLEDPESNSMIKQNKSDIFTGFSKFIKIDLRKLTTIEKTLLYITIFLVILVFIGVITTL